MLITRFHKLIQSKVVWYIILGIIVVTFVGFFTPTMRSGSGRSKPQAVGELFGRKVMPEEYRHAYQSTYLWYVLSAGRMIPMTDRLSAALHTEAWQRVAALRKAEQEKIAATDQEVVQQIQMMPVFLAENGAFDARVYRGVLEALGVSTAQVEALFREQITIHKLLFRAGQAALISSYELKRAYHIYTDRFMLDYVVLPREQVEKAVSVSREEAEALFAERAEAFRMPAKVRVSYVEFPVKDFLAQADVPEGAALEVYNRNIEKYRIETTNEAAAAEYKPFEEVEAEINKEIHEFAARRLAAAAATEFVVAVAPKAENDRPDFAGAAAAAGLKIKTLPAFGLADELQGIDETAPFRQAAFSLEDDIYASFSDAITGKDMVYVLSLEQQYPSFIPAFEAVEEKVMKAVRAQAATKALAERAMEIKETVSKALAGGASFKDAVKPFGLKVQTTEEFDVSTELTDDYADVLVPACLNVQQGELCEPAAVEGGVLIAYVAERKATDVTVGLPAIRQELVDGLALARSQQLTAEWQEHLLDDEAGFKDLLSETAEQ
jgi:hypothetical protein